MKYYSKKIKIPIFHGSLHLILSDNLKKALRKKHNFSEEWTKGLDEYDGVHFYAESSEESVYFIAIDLKELRISTVAHECNHCALRLLGNIGQPGPEPDSDEVFCYLSGWMVQNMMQFIEENGYRNETNFT